MAELVRVPHAPDAWTLPVPVQSFVADAEARMQRFRQSPDAPRIAAFVASNPRLAWHALRRIRDEDLAIGDTFIEWGSGFGAISGLAAFAGFTARGLEVEPALVAESRQLLAAHDLSTIIDTGSYLPPGAFRNEMTSETFAPADADVVYVYPWPAEQQLIREIFRRFGRDNALLVSFTGGIGLEIHRRVA